MRVCPLSSVKRHVVLGAPLPFSVRDAGRLLLLARGQVIVDEVQLESLFARGALVEVDEFAEAVKPGRRDTPAQPLARLSIEWDQAHLDVREALAAPSPKMAGAIDGATDLLLELIHRSPDLALAQVVRQSEFGISHYGVSHSIHAATACHAAARHLGWDAVRQRRAFQAGLTMNLGMVDLQTRLSTQVSPLTPKQREAIHEHPNRGAAMLSAAGIVDNDWLEAVARHHEVPDGSGYPLGTTEISALAEMLRFADVYTALLSSRAHRPAMSAQQAGRELYQMAADSAIASALIKSFGIFPPGSMVKLASGEVGVVRRNGDKAYHPLVMAVTDAAGAARLTPLPRDSAQQAHAVVALLSAATMPMRLSDEKIASLVGGD